MSGHTPGPWEAKKFPEQWVVVTSDGYPIADVSEWSPAVDEADARLMADAPDLLDALFNVVVNAGPDPSLTTCGHEFMCTCPQDAALALLRKHGRLP